MLVKKLSALRLFNELFFFIKVFFINKKYKNIRSINKMLRFSAKLPIKIDIGTMIINNSKNLFTSKNVSLLK